MSDPLPPSSEKTIVVSNPSPSLCRLWTLTIISLSLNGLILLVLVVGAIVHHHDRNRFEDRGNRGGWGGQGGPRGGGFCMMEPRGGPGPGFRHFGGPGGPGQGWGRPEGFGRGPGGMGFHGGGFGGQGPRDGGPEGPDGMPGMGGGSGMMGGFGMRGMKDGPGPDPAKMTDGILNFLNAKLTLTDDQKAKLKPIIADQVTQMQKDMEAQRDAMQKKIEEAKAKIKPLLNADQQKELDAMPLPGQKPAPPPVAK